VGQNGGHPAGWSGNYGRRAGYKPKIHNPTFNNQSIGGGGGQARGSFFSGTGFAPGTQGAILWGGQKRGYHPKGGGVGPGRAPPPLAPVPRVGPGPPQAAGKNRCPGPARRLATL